MRHLMPVEPRQVSACLFGHRHKLDLLAAIAEAPEGRVNLGHLATELGVDAAVYYPPVQDLIALGLLVQVERVRGDRRRWYARSGSEQVWADVAALVRSLQEFLPQESRSDDASVPGQRERAGLDS